MKKHNLCSFVLATEWPFSTRVHSYEPCNDLARPLLATWERNLVNTFAIKSLLSAKYGDTRYYFTYLSGSWHKPSRAPPTQESESSSCYAQLRTHNIMKRY